MQNIVVMLIVDVCVNVENVVAVDDVAVGAVAVVSFNVVVVVENFVNVYVVDFVAVVIDFLDIFLTLDCFFWLLLLFP